jgi:hypothetical protein
LAKPFVIAVESKVGINSVDIPLENLAESQSAAARKPGFFLSMFDSLLPSVWGTKRWIHCEDVANLVTEDTN